MACVSLVVLLFFSMHTVLVSKELQRKLWLQNDETLAEALQNTLLSLIYILIVT